MIRRSLARRSGFALMLVMTGILLLMIFLLAAQGSVAVSQTQMKRSSEKMDSAERTSLILARARRAYGRASWAGTKDYTLYAEGVEWSDRPLEPADEVYGRLPSLSYRSGDALVSIRETGKGFSSEASYLINGSGNRAGAIRVPAAVSAAAPAKPAAQAKPVQGAKP